MPSVHITSQYARRPRLYPHSRRPTSNNNAVTSSITSNSLQYDFDDSSTIASSSIDIKSTGDSSMATESRKDPTRFLKLLFVIFVTIVTFGGIMHVVTGKEASSKNTNTEKKSKNILRRTEQRPRGNTQNSTIPGANPSSQTYLYGKIVTVPPTLSHYADVSTIVMETDVPTFWHIPRSGGSTVKDITALCLLLTQASQVGIVGGHENDKELMVVEDLEGGKFMNVDTTTTKGLARAQQLQLASSPDLDVIVTPFFHRASRLFSTENRGRLFTMLRHPIERAASMYYALKNNPHQRGILEGASLVSYAKGTLVEDNWVTRFLANKPGGELTPFDEAVAKEILRRKFLIGLLKFKGASMDRFERYFGWSIKGEKMQDCHERILDWDWPSQNSHPPIKEGSTEWKLLENRNTFDIRLYEYAEQLFHEQAYLFEKRDDVPKGQGTAGAMPLSEMRQTKKKVVFD